MGSEIVLKPHWLQENRKSVPKVEYRAERADCSDSNLDAVIAQHMVVTSKELRLADVHPAVIKQTQIVTKNLEDAVVHREVTPEAMFEGGEIERIYSDICLPAEMYIKKIGNLYKIKSDQKTVNAKITEIKRVMPGAAVVSATYRDLPAMANVAPKSLTMPVDIFRLTPAGDIPFKEYKIYLQQFGTDMDPKFVFSKYNFMEIKQPDPTIFCVRVLDLRVLYLVNKRRLIIGGICSKPVIIDSAKELATIYVTHNTLNIRGGRHDYKVDRVYLAIPEGVLDKNQDTSEYLRNHMKVLGKQIGDKIHEYFDAIVDLKIERLRRSRITYQQTV